MFRFRNMATAPPREAPDTTGPRFTFRGTEAAEVAAEVTAEVTAEATAEATAEVTATEEEEDRTIAKGGN